MPNTFFVAVKIEDLYAHRNYISTGQKELVGLTALWVAAKILEESNF